jgi:hypothetical protein
MLSFNKASACLSSAVGTSFHLIRALPVRSFQLIWKFQKSMNIRTRAATVIPFGQKNGELSLPGGVKHSAPRVAV